VREARRIRVEGIVQGVGFRPFIYRLARENSLAGRVWNTATGVIIEAEGSHAALNRFQQEIASRHPPLAVITEITVEPAQADRYDSFSIVSSETQQAVDTLISPDIAVCDDCLRELFDSEDRRHRYPFINCTNCGPRYTIIRDLPYDRPSTTMAPFIMCPQCRREYDDPEDRRFHAQPNACPVCGPHLRLTDNRGEAIPGDPLQKTVEALKSGGVVAVKGLGGFHLACDACNEAAVRRLRDRKGRVDKPFAVMAFNTLRAGKFSRISDAEVKLLLSARRPIVLVDKLPESPLADTVAPGQAGYGVMLPYTPLHHLLLEEFEYALVLTSGNYSEEPIAIDNDEALKRLAALADLFLVHDREILLRADDSVARVMDGRPRHIRRSRGYAPQPVFLPEAVPQVLAVGPELKNTICYTRRARAFISQHIGDMENLEAFGFFQEVLGHLRKVFELDPELVAHDLHPDYLSTRWALEESGLSTVAVQHHRAHVASCLTDAGSLSSAIGIALDGTGYGDDGAIWGGEVFTGSPTDLRRAAHLAYVLLPGGDAAAREPWRCAVAHLMSAFGDEPPDLPFLARVNGKALDTVLQMLQRRINTFPTSSTGRLFDAAAAIAGVRNIVTYEAQAAMEFEALADPHEKGCYEYGVDTTREPWKILTEPIICDLADDVLDGTDSATISARFHNTLVEAFSDICARLRKSESLNRVALSGGVFQNKFLFERLADSLRRQGFEVLSHRQVPANDGGISLGQAVIAALQLKQERGKS
jgi:hydrogenase maturation protein HypF